METHVCVYQTVRDLAARGWDTHLCADAVCSRTAQNRALGLGLAARAGAIVTSTEACVFDLLGRAGSDEFRALSKAIK
jgi:nicotinamidase-related amidase